MRKPTWLRLVGWVDLALWLWCAFILYEFFTRGPLNILILGIYLFAATAFALFCLWAIVSGMVWSANRSARMQAAITREVVTRAVSSGTAPVELPTARTGIVCAKCGNFAAVLHCHRHNESICWRCAVKTDTGECAYVLANRYPGIGGEQRRHSAHTSPLSGIR